MNKTRLSGKLLHIFLIPALLLATVLSFASTSYSGELKFDQQDITDGDAATEGIGRYYYEEGGNRYYDRPFTHYDNSKSYPGSLKVDGSGRHYYEHAGAKYYDYPPLHMLQGKTPFEISGILKRSWRTSVDPILKADLRKYRECLLSLPHYQQQLENIAYVKKQSEREKKEAADKLKANLLRAMTRLGLSTAATVLDPAYDAYIMGKALKDSIVNAHKKSKLAAKRQRILGEFEALKNKVKAARIKTLKQKEYIAQLEKSVQRAAAKAEKAKAAKKAARGPPKPGKHDSNVPLKNIGKIAKNLPDGVLNKLQNKHGFRQDHAQRMSAFAQEKGLFVIVRDGNVDSIKYFSDPDYMPKPMTCKAKTAKVGKNKGLVVDPTHPVQARAWDDAIAAADPAKSATLKSQRKKAVDTWSSYGDDMINKHGYQVNKKTGVVEKVQTLPDGSKKVAKGIHGDYDLHGVYRRNSDGTIDQVSYGSGKKYNANGVDVSGRPVRKQLNNHLTGGEKDFFQHGGQDDWIPDPSKVPVKKADPGAVVFTPDGTAIPLGTAAEMKKFYETKMGVPWPY